MELHLPGADVELALSARRQAALEPHGQRLTPGLAVRRRLGRAEMTGKTGRVSVPELRLGYEDVRLKDSDTCCLLLFGCTFPGHLSFVTTATLPGALSPGGGGQALKGPEGPGDGLPSMQLLCLNVSAEATAKVTGPG